MSIKIHFDWEALQAARGPELRATWARLTLMIHDVPITQVHDYEARSVRDGIYLPLYPLAEWLAMHWWSLFYEYETPGRVVQASYATRHNWRYARDGFALPDIHMCPRGSDVAFAWQPCVLPAQKVGFLHRGTAYVKTDIVANELAPFIGAVVQRLDAEGVANTPLAEEWQAIQQTDVEARAFCEAAAALGLDPYGLDKEDEESIVQAYEALPGGVAMDFFSIANRHDLAQQVRHVLDGIRQIQALPTDLRSLHDLRQETCTMDPLSTPWAVGYEFARYLRQRLGLGDRVMQDISEFSKPLKVEDEALQRALLPLSGQPRFFDALVAVNASGSPGFLIEKSQEEARKFAFCRGLFEYLTSASDTPVILSATRSERQKRNRAFAAEFLAPAALLKQQLRGATVGEEELEELAEVFGVSSYVIRHQIENHHLACLMPN